VCHLYLAHLYTITRHIIGTNQARIDRLMIDHHAFMLAL
jgi:hypothetical protein